MRTIEASLCNKWGGLLKYDVRASAAFRAGSLIHCSTFRPAFEHRLPCTMPGYEGDALASTAPLHEAIVGEDVGAVAELLRKGVNVDETVDHALYTYGATALHLAARAGNVEMVQALLEAGAEANGCHDDSMWAEFSPLHNAAARGHVGVVQALLVAGAACDKFAMVTDSPLQGTESEDTSVTPLHLAAEAGHVNVVRALAEAGAMIDMADTGSEAVPLHYAVLNDHADVMRALMEAGADIGTVNCYGDSALHMAEDIYALKNLLEKAATLGRMTGNCVARSTSVGVAESASVGCSDWVGTWLKLRLECIRVLLRYGADTSIPYHDVASTCSGASPILSMAARHGVAGMVSALLDIGLDPNEKDSYGALSLHHAAVHGRVEVLRLLLLAGAHVNARSEGDHGSTPLHMACRYAEVECVRELLLWGADLTAQEEGVGGYGRTPADVIWLRYSYSERSDIKDRSRDEDEGLFSMDGEFVRMLAMQRVCKNVHVVG